MRRATTDRTTFEESSAPRWTMLAVIVLARVSMAVQFQTIAPVASLVVTDLALTYTQLGFLVGLYLLPGTVLALPGGMLGGRFGNRRVTFAGLALMIAGGALTAASDEFWLAAAGRIVAGAGGVLLNIVLAKMTAEWFAGKEIATAMSVMLTAWPLGIALGTGAFGAVAAASSWRVVQHVATAVAGLAIVLVAIVYRDAPGLADSRELRFWPRLPAAAWARATLAGSTWMAFNVGFIVLVTFGPALLVAGGDSLARAGLLVSLAVWISTLSVPLGGALVDRVGRAGRWIVGACLLSALALAAIPLVPGAVVWLVLVGLAIGPAPGPIVALVPKTIAAQHLGAGYGVFYASYYLGMAVMQPVAGLVRDLTGSPAAPVLFAAVMMALTVVTFGVLRRVAARA